MGKTRGSRLSLTLTAAVLAAAMGSAFVATGVAHPSAASAAESDCPLHYFCLWQNSDYTGTRWQWSEPGYRPNVWHYVGNGANDQASSAYNHRYGISSVSLDFPAGGTTDGFDNFNQTGHCFPVAVANLAGRDWPATSRSENDSISGFNLGTPTC